MIHDADKILLPSCPVCGSVEPSLYYSGTGNRYRHEPRCERGHQRRKMEYLKLNVALERLRIKVLERGE